MARRQHHVDRECGAEIDKCGNHFVDADAATGAPPVRLAPVTRVAPPKVNIQIGSGKSAPEKNLLQYSQKHNLNDMLMMKDYPMMNVQEVDSIFAKARRPPESKISFTRMQAEHDRSSHSNLQNPPIAFAQEQDCSNESNINTIGNENGINESASVASVASVDDQPYNNKSAVIKTLCRSSMQHMDMKHQMEYAGEQRLGQTENQWNKNQIRTRQRLQRSSSCMLIVKDSTNSAPMVENHCNVSTTRGIINASNEEQPKSSLNQMPNSTCDSNSRGLQRSMSLRMVPNASVSLRTNSTHNGSNREKLSRQTSVRMMPNVSFSSRGSASSNDSVRPRGKMARRSSAQMVTKVSSSSCDSHPTCEIASKRDKLHRRSSFHLVQNVSFASNRSNSSSESFATRDKASSGNSGTTKRTQMKRRVSTTSRQPSTRKLESADAPFIDRVIETSNELYNAPNSNSYEFEGTEYPFTSSSIAPKEKSRSAQPRRSSITLETFFATSQNETGSKLESQDHLENGNTGQILHKERTYFDGGFDKHHLQIYMVQHHHNDQMLQRRRGSTGTIKLSES